MNPKQIAAERAVTYIQSGMTIGLGTGSTAAYAIHALGRRIQTKALGLRCVATSRESEELGRPYGLQFVPPSDITRFDLTIDGADEVDSGFRLIKGGGGALVREKIVAAATDVEIIVVDEHKVRASLGAHPLPVAILPFAWEWTQARLEQLFSAPAPRRLLPSGGPFVTDDGLFLLDMAFGAPLPFPDTLEGQLKAVVGVVEVGLFVGLCQRLIIGYDDGRIEEKPRLPGWADAVFCDGPGVSGSSEERATEVAATRSQSPPPWTKNRSGSESAQADFVPLLPRLQSPALEDYSRPSSAYRTGGPAESRSRPGGRGRRPSRGGRRSPAKSAGAEFRCAPGWRGRGAVRDGARPDRPAGDRTARAASSAPRRGRQRRPRRVRSGRPAPPPVYFVSSWSEFPFEWCR